MLGLVISLISLVIAALIFAFTNPNVVDAILFGLFIPLIVHFSHPEVHPAFLVLIGIGVCIGVYWLMKTFVGMILSGFVWCAFAVMFIQGVVSDKIWRVVAIVVALIIIIGGHIGAYIRGGGQGLARFSKKGLLIGLAIIAGVLIVVPVTIHGVAVAKRNTPAGQALTDKSLLEYHNEQLKASQSDISGMTKYDKVKAGLASYDGSDTDRDGVSDKDEIEVYKSNPLKRSTAGDFYTDGYKVANGMDVNTYADYQGEPLSYPNNTCTNITLKGEDADDLDARIVDVTGIYEAMASPKSNAYSWARTYNVYRDYEINGFRGALSIDVSGLLKEKELKLNDLIVLLSTDVTFNNLQRVNYEASGNIITPDLSSVKEKKSYLLVIADKRKSGILSNFAADVSAVFGGSSGTEMAGDGDILFSAWGVPTMYLKQKPKIYYLSTGDETKDNEMIQTAIDAADYYYGFGDERPEVSEAIKLDQIGFRTKKSFHQGALKLFEFKPYGEDENYWNIVYGFFTNEDIDRAKADEIAKEKAEAEAEAAGQTMLSRREAFMKTDILPFSNFGSYISSGGNCAGIARLTALIYNTGTIPSSGSYDFSHFPFLEQTELGVVNWELTSDEENKTLMDPGLWDYKDSSFTFSHLNDGIIDNALLTPGEQQFINMIGCYWGEFNAIAVTGEMQDHTVYNMSTECLTYKTVRQMMEAIDSGKVLECAMLFYDPTKMMEMGCCWDAFWGGHAINLYDYHQEMVFNRESGLVTCCTYFDVYDNNYPHDDSKRKLFMASYGMDDDSMVFDYGYATDEYVASGRPELAADMDMSFIVTDEALNPLTEIYGIPEQW